MVAAPGVDPHGLQVLGAQLLSLPRGLNPSRSQGHRHRWNLMELEVLALGAFRSISTTPGGLALWRLACLACLGPLIEKVKSILDIARS
eukprot:CAMPEP_0184288448 /NCGR_PEP_ID=MMETSP1049-20130417/971_1 /TAXON_ID=77928 /ORGANISM="Proteomonas sulcata, Strain CCMP704" /LENGTH=88 /DNA_ID=CAMNT_0026594845 /DNA_START=344 /DNA_END=611 /DNA_ORIENTATION=+